MSDVPPPAETIQVVQEAQAAAAETIHQAAEAVKVAERAKEPRPNQVVVLAVRGIILTTSIALAGTIGLISQGKSPPDGVIAVASAGVGALSTLLTVQARGSRDDRRD